MKTTRQQLRRIIRETVREEIYHKQQRPVQLITEGFGWKDAFKDVAQAAASTGAIAATGGAGGDVVVDVMFAIDTGKEILEEVEGAISKLGEFQSVVGKALAVDIGIGTNAFYQDVKLILADAMLALGDQGKVVIDKLSSAIEKVIGKIVRAISKWVSALFPDDFGLAGPTFQVTVSNAISGAAESAFDLVAGGIESLGETGEMLVNADAMEKFLRDIATGLLDFIKDIQHKLNNPDPEKTGIFNMLKGSVKYQYETMASVTGLASLADKVGFETDSMGEDYLQMLETLPSWHPSRKLLTMAVPKMVEWLEISISEYIPLAGKIMSKLISYLFASIALLQLVSNPEEREEILGNGTDKDETESSSDIQEQIRERRRIVLK